MPPPFDLDFDLEYCRTVPHPVTIVLDIEHLTTIQ